ncbi:hypothetical protein DVR12_07545 [Chitinophaga silvatica]|uniref:Type VI secretion system transmembrane protein TssO n=1 Tax=Chitinophaga silvatica TaxID=2282649 RepID=A0A3E1YEQ0_9BACT|nr:type VI secretion system TssO [Chitinophaga silvatica]RFS25030.1 hypothetical protein DVR12_07545 [Chitinophaga silvatica]
MEALNKEARMAAFWTFLLFFVVTATLLIITIFFSVQAPIQENLILRKEIDGYKNDFLFQEYFHKRINEVKRNLDIVNAPEQNASYIDQIVASALADLRGKIPQPSSYFPFYDNIIQIFLALQQNKQQLRTLLHAQEEIISLREKAARLNEQLEMKSRDLDNCRQMLLLNSKVN